MILQYQQKFIFKNLIFPVFKASHGISEVSNINLIHKAYTLLNERSARQN